MRGCVVPPSHFMAVIRVGVQPAFTREDVVALEPSGAISLFVSIVPSDVFSVPLPVTEPV